MAAVLLSWAILAGAAGAFAQPGEEMRTWTDLDGRRIEAALLGVEEENVVIRRSDGERFTFPASRLSEADRAYIRAWLERQGNATEPPPERATDWPARVRGERPDVEIVRESDELSVYRTQHFEFRCDARLSRGLVRQLAEMFEATYAAAKALPIGLAPEPPQGESFVTRIFTEHEDYLKAGGVPNSAGLYRVADRMILVPIASLGVRRSSSGFTYDSHAEDRTLIHEITHQVMHPWLSILPVWVAEGLATYMETIPYSNGVFHLRQQNLRDYLDTRAPGIGPPWPIIPLETLLNLSQREWNTGVATAAAAAGMNYYSSTAVVHYFLHEDGEGDAERFLRYIHSVRRGIAEEEARDLLLDGRTYEELQTEMIRSLGRRGIRLTS